MTTQRPDRAHRRSPDDADAPGTRPRWGILAASMLAAGTLMLPLVRQGVGLYLYAFPLFALGVTYVLQFRRELSRAWWITFVAITPLSAIALALDWPFSGHVLWNILFLAHSSAVVRSRAWTWLFGISLLYLVVLKAIDQTSRDLFGAVLSAGIAIAIVLLLRTHGDLQPSKARGGIAGDPPLSASPRQGGPPR